MARYTISYAKNIMRRTIQVIVDPEPSNEDKARIWNFFNGCCAYCGKRLYKGARKAHLDHLISVGQGGNALSNFVLSCGVCNGDEKRDLSWETFLKFKNPDQKIYKIRRAAIIRWQKQLTSKTDFRKAKALRDALKRSEEAVILFERRCNELRKVFSPGGHRNSPTCGHPKFPHP